MGSIVFGIFAFCVDALAVWLVWGWHGVAIGWPALTFWRAAGVSALWSLFAYRPSITDVKTSLDAPKGEQDKLSFTVRIFWLINIVALVAIAWIAKQFA